MGTFKFKTLNSNGDQRIVTLDGLIYDPHPLHILVVVGLEGNHRFRDVNVMVQRIVPYSSLY